MLGNRMHARDMKDGVYEQFARIGKAVSAPKRIELLELLCQGPRTVEALAGQAGLTVANASQHLKLLLAARLVEAHKRGLFVEYRLADEGVLRFVQSMRELATARFAEVGAITEAFLKERGALEPVSGDELLRRVRDGEVIVLDVRPAQEYHAGHIPGARSVPVSEMKRHLAKLPKNREIVAYCRGPQCVMAIEAVELLRKKGFRARRMEQGVMDWRARGWKLQKSPAQD
jgi:rhodanese-related sulfurtransferase/DNA-binding MarR family transcriptional regulator